MLKKNGILMKKLIIISTAILLQSLFADTYFLKTQKQEENSIFVKMSVDSNGFYSNGNHKDTGTQYNTEGFDKEGFDIEGLSKSSCIYHETTDHIKVDGRYPLKVIHQGVSISNHTYTSTSRGYETDLYVYSRGDIKWSTSYWNQKKYELCIQNKKQ